MKDKDKKKIYAQKTAAITPKKAVLSDYMNERYSEVLKSGFPISNYTFVNPIKDCLTASFAQTSEKKAIFSDT